MDIVAGVFAAAALWLRRRWPVGVAVGVLPLVVVAPSAGVAALFAGFTVAVHRPLRTAAAVAAVQVVFAVVGHPVRPGPVSYGATVVIAVLAGAVVLAWGQMVRARRLLELSLRQQVTRVEAERQLRPEHPATPMQTREADHRSRTKTTIGGCRIDFRLSAGRPPANGRRRPPGRRT